MAKFTLTPAIFKAEYSADFGGVNDKSVSLETDGDKYDGFDYQEDGQFVFHIARQDVPIWASDIEEVTLGVITHFRGNTFTTNAELKNLIEAYSDMLMGLD